MGGRCRAARRGSGRWLKRKKNLAPRLPDPDGGFRPPAPPQTGTEAGGLGRGGHTRRAPLGSVAPRPRRRVCEGGVRCDVTRPGPARVPCPSARRARIHAGAGRGFAGQVRTRRARAAGQGGAIWPSLMVHGVGLCSASARSGPGHMRRPQAPAPESQVTWGKAWCRCMNLEEKPRAGTGHPTPVPTWLRANLCSRSKSHPSHGTTRPLRLRACCPCAQPYTGGYTLRACATAVRVAGEKGRRPKPELILRPPRGKKGCRAAARPCGQAV